MFCPVFDIQNKVPAAQISAGICLEEDRVVLAFVTHHAFFLIYTGGTDMLNLVLPEGVISKDVIL
jgi:hypothetical protein